MRPASGDRPHVFGFTQGQRANYQAGRDTLLSQAIQARRVYEAWRCRSGSACGQERQRGAVVEATGDQLIGTPRSKTLFCKSFENAWICVGGKRSGETQRSLPRSTRKEFNLTMKCFA